MAATYNNATTKSLFWPNFTLSDYELINNSYLYLQESTQNGMLKAFSIITLRTNKQLIIRLRHAVCILVQLLLRWRELLNRSRVILDERMEIPFLSLERHEMNENWESPTMEVIFKQTEEIMALADSVRQIIDLSRFTLPLLLE